MCFKGHCFFFPTRVISFTPPVRPRSHMFVPGKVKSKAFKPGEEGVLVLEGLADVHGKVRPPPPLFFFFPFACCA